MTMRRSHQDGFTLVELLVAVGAMALILGFLAAGMRLVSATVDRTENTVAMTETMTILHQVLRRQLTGAFRLGVGDPPRLAFRGGADFVRFVVAEPPYPTKPGLYHVTIAVETTAAGRRLVYERRPVIDDPVPGATGIAETERSVLAEGPFRFVFAYYGDPRRDAPAVWHDRWTSALTLPQLVRLRVLDEKTGRAVTPDLVAKPMIEIEAACLYPNSVDFCFGPP